MGYRYRSRRSAKRLARKSKRNFIITFIMVGLLIYAVINWILPNFIGGIGTIKNTLAPDQQIIKTAKNSALAPPVLNIPFEATNSAQIAIKGFGVPESKIKIFIDDEEKAKVEVAKDGSFTTESIELSLGINNIFGKTVDDKGLESLPSKTIRLIYDDEKPVIDLNEPEDGKIIQGGDKKVKVSGKTEINAKVFLSDSQVVVDKDGNFSRELDLNDGENTILIKALDSAGNITEMERKVIFQP